MSSVRPARRFDALRALTWLGVPSRIAPDGGPPCAFAPLQRSIAAPPHRPADPKAAGRRCFLSWAFVPYDTCGTADPFSRGFRPLGVPRPGFETPFAASTTVPPASCDAERPWASPSKAFSSKRSGPLVKSPALLAFTASIRLAPLGSVRTRSPSGLRSRLELVLPFRIPKDPARRCLPGLCPFRARSSARRSRFVFAERSPLTRWVDSTSDLPASQGISARRT